jgi:hypothetical protein
MEYLLGSILTLVTMTVVSRMVRKTQTLAKSIRLDFSQSRQYELVRYYLPITKKEITTQSSKHYRTQWSRVVISGDLAYWIEDSSVYSAKHDGAEILPETKKVVDMMGIDKVELDKMILIIDKLTEGN